MRIEVAEQPAPCENRRDEHSAEGDDIHEPMVPGAHNEHDQCSEHDQKQGNDAMEATGLRVRPGVERPNDLTP